MFVVVLKGGRRRQGLRLTVTVMIGWREFDGRIEERGVRSGGRCEE